MNVHIILEDVSYTLNAVKEELVNKLKEYPKYKETFLSAADYLIIIPDYPTAGEQRFNRELVDLILNHTYHINHTYLLDRDFSLMPINEKKWNDDNLHFLEENLQITDVFGLSPKDVKEATNFIKTGKKPEIIQKLDSCSMPIREIKPKRRLLLG